MARRRATALAAAVTIAWPAGIGSAADPDPILHLFSRSAKGEICLIDGDGTDRRCLTDNRRFDYDAVWSPDRARIAFVEQTNNPRNPDIYVMNADGTGKRRLTRSPQDDETPQWSPDGTQIVWQRNRGDSVTGKLMVMNADGTNKHFLVGDKGDNTSPMWSPDGAQLVFMSRDPCFTDACEDYQFELHVVNTDGTDERSLTQTDERELFPVWSPDGSQVAFVRESEEDVEIFIVNADGSDARQVTDVAGMSYLPAWSPDGQTIAFTEVTNWEDFDTHLGVVDVETGEERALTDDEMGGIGPTWSPSGEYIAFSAFRRIGMSSSYEIHTIRPDGTELVRLTRTLGDEAQLHWRP